jgi:hypothetical protein
MEGEAFIVKAKGRECGDFIEGEVFHRGWKSVG